MREARIIRNALSIIPASYLEVLCNFTNQSLEWQLADQQLSTLLVLTDFTANLSTNPSVDNQIMYKYNETITSNILDNILRPKDRPPPRSNSSSCKTYRRATVPGR